MGSVIQHKPASEPIGPGEISIDVDNRTLNLETFRGVRTLPLDFVALEQPDYNAGSQLYILDADGVARLAAYDAGAGGQAQDGKPFRVLGLTPTGLSTVTTTDHTALFEVAYPTLVSQLRTRVTAGSAAMTWSIERPDGEVLISYPVTAQPTGDIYQNVSLFLDPGRYVVRLEAASVVTVRVVEGRLPWTPDVQRHPLMMETL